ncbi:MAG: sigma-70 family RNA polymerase sigma factor, partial [Pseudomonadota bacterium]
MDDLLALKAVNGDSHDEAHQVLQRPTGPPAKHHPQNDDIAELYCAHLDELVVSLRKAFGAGPPDPEDIAQQAFQKLIERGNREDIRNLKAFLWRIARNTLLKAVKKETVRSRHDFEIEHLFFPARGDESTPET